MTDFQKGDSRTCSVCEITYEHFGQTSALCREHYNERMAQYMLNRYHRRRESFIESRGRKCQKCGSPGPEFEIDHRDQHSKSFSVSKAFSGWSEKRLQAELVKCQLLCLDCHHAKTRRDLAERFGQRERWEHGTLAGKRYCDCTRCRKAKRDYTRKYRARKRAEQKTAD